VRSIERIAEKSTGKEMTFFVLVSHQDKGNAQYQKKKKNVFFRHY